MSVYGGKSRDIPADIPYRCEYAIESNAQLYVDTQKLYPILAQVSAVVTSYSNILLLAFCYVFVSPKQMYYNIGIGCQLAVGY